jgi:GxxExxY protein
MESQSHEAAKITVVDRQTEVLAREIVDSIFKVHRYFGPGMLESIYEAALCKEFDKRNIRYTRQEQIPVFYDGDLLGEAFRADLIIENTVLLELKACEKLLPVHKAQALSYIRLSNKPLGFLVNFNNNLIKDGIVRIINDRFAS